MAKRTENNQEFNAWIKTTTAEKGRSRSRCDTWPENVTAEIKKVIAGNDRGSCNITMRDMMARMKEAHGVEATQHDLRHYATSILGRKSWGKK